jgi:hypothetical protein
MIVVRSGAATSLFFCEYMPYDLLFFVTLRMHVANGFWLRETVHQEYQDNRGQQNSAVVAFCSDDRILCQSVRLVSVRSEESVNDSLIY